MSLLTDTGEPGLLQELKIFSSWSRLVSFIKTLEQHARKYNKAEYIDNMAVRQKAEVTNIRLSQQVNFFKDLYRVQNE